MGLKTIVVYKNTGVINNIVDSLIDSSMGYQVVSGNETYIIGYSQDCKYFRDIDTPVEVIPHKYKYSLESGFVINTDYVEPPKPIEVQVAENKTEVESLKTDFNNAIMELSMAIAMTDTGV